MPPKPVGKKPAAAKLRPKAPGPSSDVPADSPPAAVPRPPQSPAPLSPSRGTKRESNVPPASGETAPDQSITAAVGSASGPSVLAASGSKNLATSGSRAKTAPVDSPKARRDGGEASMGVDAEVADEIAAAAGAVALADAPTSAGGEQVAAPPKPKPKGKSAATGGKRLSSSAVGKTPPAPPSGAKGPKKAPAAPSGGKKAPTPPPAGKKLPTPLPQPPARPDPEGAARKIQALARGRQARRSVTNTREAQETATEERLVRESEEYRLTPDPANAARTEDSRVATEAGAATAPAAGRNKEEEAATKIQAAARGRQARKAAGAERHEAEFNKAMPYPMSGSARADIHATRKGVPGGGHAPTLTGSVSMVRGNGGVLPTIDGRGEVSSAPDDSSAAAAGGKVSTSPLRTLAGAGGLGALGDNLTAPPGPIPRELLPPGLRGLNRKAARVTDPAVIALEEKLKERRRKEREKKSEADRRTETQLAAIELRQVERAAAEKERRELERQRKTEEDAERVRRRTAQEEARLLRIGKLKGVDMDVIRGAKGADAAAEDRFRQQLRLEQEERNAKLAASKARVAPRSKEEFEASIAAHNSRAAVAKLQLLEAHQTQANEMASKAAEAARALPGHSAGMEKRLDDVLFERRRQMEGEKEQAKHQLASRHEYAERLRQQTRAATTASSVIAAAMGSPLKASQQHPPSEHTRRVGSLSTENFPTSRELEGSGQPGTMPSPSPCAAQKTGDKKHQRTAGKQKRDDGATRTAGDEGAVAPRAAEAQAPPADSGGTAKPKKPESGAAAAGGGSTTSAVETKGSSAGAPPACGAKPNAPPGKARPVKAAAQKTATKGAGASRRKSSGAAAVSAAPTDAAGSRTADSTEVPPAVAASSGEETAPVVLEASEAAVGEHSAAAPGDDGHESTGGAAVAALRVKVGGKKAPPVGAGAKKQPGSRKGSLVGGASAAPRPAPKAAGRRKPSKA